MTEPNGYIVWRGPSPLTGDSIVMLAVMQSANKATGNMVQTYILVDGVQPHHAVKTGLDEAVCGGCDLRGDLGRNRVCYVQTWRNPASVWKAYKNGRYVDATLLSYTDLAALFAGAYVRLGAYGDPAMLPYDVVAAIVAQAAGWTGYTHQWPWCDPSFADFLMASVETQADRHTARAKGYRCFFVVPEVADPGSVPGTMWCAKDRPTNRLQCIDCLACSGTRRGTVPSAVDVVIGAHGSGKGYL